jgi:hypothetical protein
LICAFHYFSLTWKSHLSCCHRALVFDFKIYADISLSIIHHKHIYIHIYVYLYVYVSAYVYQSHLIAHSFCFYWRDLQNISLSLIDDEVLLSFIHKWSVCVMKDRETEEKKSPKTCDDTLHRSFISLSSFFFSLIDPQLCIMFRDIEWERDNWSNKSIYNVIKRSIFEWYISYKFIYNHLIIDVYFLYFSFFFF